MSRVFALAKKIKQNKMMQPLVNTVKKHCPFIWNHVKAKLYKDSYKDMVVETEDVYMQESIERLTHKLEKALSK